VRNLLKSAFTSWPHCVATYVCLIGATWLLAFGWKPVKKDFPIYDSPIAESMAHDTADKLGGRAWAVGFTGSMKPLLQGGEFVVTVDKFETIEAGQVLVYRANYHDKPIIHRAVLKDKHGWLMSGDSAPISESWSRVTRENYVGTAVLGYRKILQ
jgi:hypothetical protein